MGQVSWLRIGEVVIGQPAKIDFWRWSARFTAANEANGGELDSTGLRKSWLRVVVDQKAT